MFEFIERFDEQIYKRAKSIENNIKMKDGSVIVSFQSFFESMFKKILLNEKVNEIFSKSESLTSLILNKRLEKIINKMGFNAFTTIDEINRIANTHKHDRFYRFEETQVKKYLKCVYYLSISVHNYYYQNKIIDDFPEQAYLQLINEDTLKQFIIKRIEEEHEIEKVKLEKEIEVLNGDIKVLSSKLEKAIQENETNEFNIDINTKKTIEFNENLREIERLKEENLKLKSDLEDDIMIENYQKINELTNENRKLEAEINNLKSLIENVNSANVEKYKLLIKEKDIELSRLKQKNSNPEIKVIDENIYEKYRQMIKTITFGNSYLNDDQSFTIYNLDNLAVSSSKYKSFYAVVNNLLQRNKQVKKSAYLRSLTLTEAEDKEIIRLEMLILSLIKNNRLNDDTWKINYLGGRLELLKIAATNIINYLKLLCSLSRVNYHVPVLNFKTSTYDETFVNIAYDNDFIYDEKTYIIKDDYSHRDLFNFWSDDKIYYPIDETDEASILILLEELFNHSCFKPGQYNILCNVMKGRNTIGILPTSGGKSLIFQLFALLQPKITIIIAPLNALINDQIDNLKNRYQISRVLSITSDDNTETAIRRFKNSEAMYVYISPERVQSEKFRDTLILLENQKIFDTIVLDEVHCLSEWGHDFRISYLMLSHTLNTYCAHLQYLGLTATASINVVKDLQVELNIKTPQDVIFSKKLKRENLYFKIIETENELEMKHHIKQTLSENYGRPHDLNIQLNGDKTNAIVVFSKTRPEINRLHQDFSEVYEDETSKFYSDYKDEYDSFINNKKSLLFTTKAFGMGIDKPNIRRTYHYGLPSSREQFYQEAGRAGRDGELSSCYMLTYQSKEHESLINEFLDLNTDVDRLMKIQKLLNNSKVDLSVNFYFMLKGINEPEKETERLFSYYKNLINMANDLLNISYKLIKQDEEESFFYVLHKIGIVDNWSLNYRGRYDVYVKLYFNKNHKNIEHIKLTTLKYLSLYANAKDEMDLIRQINSLNELSNLILIVRKWYHKTFINTRREQLANIYSFSNKYKNQEASEEIQNELEQFFDITSLIDMTQEGYHLTLENDNVQEVIEKVTNLPVERIAIRVVELERLLESTSNINIELYTSLINLRNHTFESRNGKDRLYHVLDVLTKEEIKLVYQTSAVLLYPSLSEVLKEHLLKALFEYNSNLFKDVFLRYIDNDQVNLKYFIYYINHQLKEIIA